VSVAFDSGGTFTDVVIQTRSGDLITAKLLSVFESVGSTIAELAGAHASDTDSTQCIHATTVLTNAILQGMVAPTGLLATPGFRDDLEMRGQRRPNIFDMDWERLPPLVPRRLRLEVDEAVRADGSIERPLDTNQAEAAIRGLIEAGVEAIAVSLLNAYANPVHEMELARRISELAPHLKVSVSTDVHREIGEYPRTSTAVINASLMPVFGRYMDTLADQLGKLAASLLIMQSNGGMMTAAKARRWPAYVVESGPAAGVLAASQLALAVQLPRVLSLDMGGTTAKACFVEHGSPLEKPSGEIGGEATVATRLFGGGGHALRVPSLDIVEVGAGGGSVAWVDESGIVRVGPRSAGARPGPACYGQGGVEPTVTDANVVLGYISPKSIAGAEVEIDREAALEAIRVRIAEPAGLEVYPAALGVYKVANAAMMRALRAVSTERGRDPRDSVLMAFGGAGPIHAALLAESLGIRTVYVPKHAGLFSAKGLLMAEFRHDEIRSLAVPLDALRSDLLDEYWTEMESAGVAAMAEESTAAPARMQRSADMKYRFQAEHLTVPFPPAIDGASPQEQLEDAFKQVHDESFGHVAGDQIELVNLRLRVTSTNTQWRFESSGEIVRPAAGPRQLSTRMAYFEPTGHQAVEVVPRADVQTGEAGPLIVEEPDTTVVIPPGWTVALDTFGNLVLSMAAG
jgi:N-methylhydantoinase A